MRRSSLAPHHTERATAARVNEPSRGKVGEIHLIRQVCDLLVTLRSRAWLLQVSPGASTRCTLLNYRGSRGSTSLTFRQIAQPQLRPYAPAQSSGVRFIGDDNVISVAPGAPVQEIAAILTEHRISSAPVISKMGRLVGIVSEGDLIRRAELATEPRRAWWPAIVTDSAAAARSYIRSHGRTACDVMTWTWLRLHLMSSCANYGPDDTEACRSFTAVELSE